MRFLSRPGSPEVSLWRAVVLQALLDAMGRSLAEGPTEAARAEARERARSEAAAWPGDPDFAPVCEMADLAPDRVRARFAEIARV